MIVQDNFVKYLNIYNGLKNEYRGREEKVLNIIRKATGEIWDKEDVEELLNQKRPALDYDLIEDKRNGWIGTERSSRVNMRAIPRKNATTQKAFQMTSAMYWNYSKGFYDSAKSKQFMYTLFGIGWLNDYWDFAQGHMIWKPMDTLRVRWDKRTQDLLFLDCGFMQDTQWLTKEKIINLCPDRATKRELQYQFKFHEPTGSNAFFEKYYSGGGSWFDIDRSAGGEDWDYTDFRDGRYRTIEHHERRDETVTIFYNNETKENFNAGQINQQQIDAFINENGEQWQAYDYTKQKLYQAMIVPAVKMVIYEAPYDLDTPFYSFKPCVAYDIKPEIFDVKGVLEGDIKINEGYNKRQSVLLEYAIDTVGGEVIAEDEAIADYAEDWQTRSKKFVRRYKAGTNMPVRQQPGQVPATLFQYANNEVELLDKRNIGLSYRGIKESANETGKLAQTKIQQTEMKLQHIFDNARTSQYMDAYSAILHIKKYMNEEAQIRLLDSNEYITLNQDTMEGKVNAFSDDESYEIEIDTTRPSATGRQFYFQELIGMLQYIPIDMINLTKVFEASDLPYATELANFARARYKAMGIDADNPEKSQGQQIGSPMGNAPVSQAGSLQQVA